MLQQNPYSSSAVQTGISTASDNGYVVGVDIGGTNMRLALADMTGVIQAKWGVSTAGIRDAQAVVGLICEGVEKLLQQTSISRSKLRAIAAGAPGVTNVDEGIVIATSYLLGWRDVPLRTLLESALGIPAAVDNDVNMAAIAESRIGAAKGTRDFVFVAVGTGIGAGIVLDGQIFHGMGWTAGEIGYMLVPGTPAEAVERGKPGALERLVGGEGIREQWQSLWHKDKTQLPKELTATQIFDHALTGDLLAQVILQKSAQTLAYAIYNISLIFNCPLFVLGGGVGMHPALCDAMQGVLDQRGARALPKLVHSTLGADAQLFGAICVALDIAEAKSVSHEDPALTSVEE